MITPDMTGRAADIADPILLFQRIGYRRYLIYRDGPNPFYEGFIKAELRRLAEREGRNA